MTFTNPKYDLDNLSVRVGKNLRRFRKEVKYSQQKLADESNLDRSYIGRIENAQVKVTLYILAKLANTLNISIEDFLKEEMVNAKV